jgi:uncharacterized repeat protein (TIGR01451 family)
VSLEWIGPSATKVTRRGEYTLVVQNQCTIPVQQVLVRVRMPASLEVTATEPKAVAEGNVFVWELATLPPHEVRRLQMKVTAKARGDVAPQAWVTFTGSAVTRVKIREPKLLLKTQAPDHVLVGDAAAITLTVSNPGDGSADQVKVHAALSEGLENARGSKIDVEVGDVAAGESRTVTLLCATRTGGPQKVDVSADADGGLTAHDAAPITVTTPRLNLEVIGPSLRYLGRKALYTLKVTNGGDAPAANVSVSDVVPDGFRVMAASQGGRHDYSGRSVSWFLGEIGPGQSREVQLEAQAIKPGDHKHQASAAGARGLHAEADLTTKVEGLSALMVEMVDTEDPIEVKSGTSYEVRITNTGSKMDTDVKLVATIPDQMEFESAMGPAGPAHCHAEGKTIVFDPIERLAPRADAIFRINVKALQAGTVRFKIQVTSASLVEPVIKMEATRIYSDAPDNTHSQSVSGAGKMQ